MSAITIDIDTLEQLTEKMTTIVNKVEAIENSLLNEPKFYTIDETAKLLGWSKTTVQELFNCKDFPCCDFGKRKVVEISALKKYFSVPRRK